MSFRRYGARERRGLIILALIVFAVLACGVWYTGCSDRGETPESVVTIITTPSDSLSEDAGEAGERVGDTDCHKARKKASKRRKKSKGRSAAIPEKRPPRDFMRDTVSPR